MAFKRSTRSFSPQFRTPLQQHDRTVIPILSEDSIHNDTRLVVMTFTALACRKYLKFNITSLFTLLTDIEVFDTGKCTHKHLELAQVTII